MSLQDDVARCFKEHGEQRKEIATLKAEVTRLTKANENWHTRVVALTQDNESYSEKLTAARREAPKIFTIQCVACGKTNAVNLATMEKEANE